MQRPRETLTHGPVTLHRWRAGAGPAAELAQAVTESAGLLRPFMPWARGEYGLADAEQFLDSCEQGWEAGTEFSYAIRSGPVPASPVPASPALAGGAGLMGRIGPDGLEIGYWVHAGHVRRGLATAATIALITEAFTLPGISRVEIRHDELNTASGGIPRKLGFTYVRSVPGSDSRLDGTEPTDLVWEITRERWGSPATSGPAQQQ
ncbi:MAG TPA: GNAT family N-acetyltransferase [Streptosporangiaceae bacterium]|jgi:RimJ/RimL family protein N-acetyltransferase|nr:GNAT family N-acetyltransferase [Streptosporangiaceae bacterium]